jgi:hypothetical protein
MQFQIGPPPDSPEFIPDDEWHALRESSPWRTQLLALPFGLVATFCVTALWFLLTPLTVDSFFSLFDSLGPPLISILLMVIVHELIHATSHPHFGASDQTVVGFWPSRMIFYAHYAGERTRNRFIACLLMPTVIISLVPLALSAITGLVSGLMAWISICNVFCACMDLCGAILLAFQVPRQAIVRNQGWRTYWRKS